MEDMNKQARMKVLQELRKAAMDDMGEGMQGHMKKVTVAAPDSEHLSEGLDKAKSMLNQMPEDETSEEPQEESPMDAPPGAHSEPTSPEEIDAKIMDLLNQKQQMLAKGR